MRHNTITAKIFLTLFSFGLILWLGGAIVRMSTAYDIYKPFSEMELKDGYSEASRVQTVKLFSYGALYSQSGFFAAAVGLIALSVLFRENFNQNGWMFMALALFIIAIPWAIYESIMDLRLFYFIKKDNISFDDKLITELFVYRFSKLSPWAMISYFSVLSSIAVIIWRPLQRVSKELRNERENETK